MSALTLVKPLYTPPPIPHKMEIIPIHTSDRATFKFCRRKWNWSSPMRHNLRSRVDQVGVDKNLWFGTGIHYALEEYYNPMLQRDPEEAFRYWFQLVWEGGIVTEDELELCYDPHPRPIVNTGDKELETYTVLGLRDLMPAIIEEEVFLEHRELGINMMKFYRDQFAPAKDNFTVIVAEHQFSVPLGMEAIDPRDGKKKEVHYRGKQDAIIMDNESERFGIKEHKTASVISEDYFRKLEKDEQVTSYMFAAEIEAEVYDLPYKQVDFTLYTAMRKVFPRPPTMLKSGLFSINRTEESTTPELLAQFIEDNGIQMIVDNDEKLKAYVEYVGAVGYDAFVQRKFVTRNRSEVRSCGWRVRAEVEDMLAIPIEYNTKLYPNPTGDRYCLNCPFRAPCIAYDDGSDYETMLEAGYEGNVGR